VLLFFRIESHALSVKPLAFVAPTSVAVPPRPAVLRVMQPRPSFAEVSRSPRSRRLLLIGIAALHLLGLWGLSQVQDLRRRVAQVAPVVVRLIAPSEPPQPLPPPPLAMPDLKAPALTLVEPPLIAVAAAPAPSPVVAPPPQPAVVPMPAAPATVVVQVTPPPPAIKRLPATAVRWLKEPRWTVPLMSRRLRESGVVHLRVVVDLNGVPREVALAKSSGYPRLDEQALLDMRHGRFVPYTENGQPVEWEVIAPVSYEIDR